MGKPVLDLGQYIHLFRNEEALAHFVKILKEHEDEEELYLCTEDGGVLCEIVFKIPEHLKKYFPIHRKVDDEWKPSMDD